MADAPHTQQTLEPTRQDPTHAPPDAATRDTAGGAGSASSRLFDALSLAAAADPATPANVPISRKSVLALQRTAGNRATTRRLQLALQRVPVSVTTTGETLYNQTAPNAPATAAHYSTTGRYDLTRQGGTGATATVKIKFLNQARNTVAPPPGAPPGTPQVGQLVGAATEIPASDPRRAWATTTAASAVAHWNNHLTLTGEEHNLLSADMPLHLPVTFQAVPVFGINDDAHQVVIVHPPATQGGSTGNPIDAGNYYMNKNDQIYPENNDIIYAHEYGHLLGIPDEYSQSNSQLNLLLHQAASGSAASSMAALDQTTVERMALAALSRPLYGQLAATLPSVTAAIRTARPQVKARLSRAARDGVKSADVRGELQALLATSTEAKLAPNIPAVVAFETTTNFSNLDLADQSVQSAFATAGLTTLIQDAYWKALTDPQGAPVAVPDFGNVSVNVQGSVYGAAATGTPLAGAAGSVATSTVGAAPARPGLPAVAPPASLAGQLSALPATWATAGSALQTGITAAAFAAKAKGVLQAAGLLEALAGIIPGATPSPRIATNRALYDRAYRMLQNAAKTAADQLTADLLTSQITPILTASATTLQSTVRTEVTRLMTSTPSALAASPAPDPNMAAIVAGMKTRLDAAKAATATSGRDPLGTGAAAPGQDVTYSYRGLMGTSATPALRPDQFQTLVDQFNANFKGFFEKPFTAEVR